MLNKVILMGRLTRDPEIRYSQGNDQTAIARFTLAVDRRYNRNGDQTADFINCVSFGKSAEFAEKYFKQGTKIVAVGRLQTGSFTNKDGNKVYATDVIVDEQFFAESKKSSSADSNNQPSSRISPEIAEGFMSIPEGIEDDLPFK